MHGKTSPIYHKSKRVFKNLPNPFDATRYHSLIVEKSTFPDCLEITAWTEENELMGLMHKEYPLHGVQFHPESILTKEGKIFKKLFNALVQVFICNWHSSVPIKTQRSNFYTRRCLPSFVFIFFNIINHKLNYIFIISAINYIF